MNLVRTILFVAAFAPAALSQGWAPRLWTTAAPTWRNAPFVHDQARGRTVWWSRTEEMGSDPSRFKLHMDAHAANALMRSHFGDFASNPVTVVTHIYN